MLASDITIGHLKSLFAYNSLCSSVIKGLNDTRWQHFSGKGWFGKCRRFQVNTRPLPTPLWPGCTVITPQSEPKQLFPSLLSPIRAEHGAHTSSQSHCHPGPHCTAPSLATSSTKRWRHSLASHWSDHTQLGL